MEAEAEAVDGRLKKAEAKEKLTAVASLVIGMFRVADLGKPANNFSRTFSRIFDWLSQLYTFFLWSLLNGLYLKMEFDH